MKNYFRENDLFSLMISRLGAKTIDLKSHLIEKRYQGMKRAP